MQSAETPSSARSLREQLVASPEVDAEGARAIFTLIEDASLKHLAGCIADCEHALCVLPPRASARIATLKGLAHVLCFENRFAEATEHLAHAITLARSLGREQEAAAMRLTQVQPLERLGKVREAVAAAKEAMESFEQLGDQAGMGRALVNLGVVRRVQGDANDAVRCFARAEPLLAGNALALGTLSTNLAEALLDLDQLSDAEAAFARAREFFASQGHTLGVAITTANLADVHARVGKIDEAVLAFEQARACFAQCEASADEARLLAEEAEAYASVGAFHRAIRLYKKALPHLEREGLSLERRRACLGLARALLRTGARGAALRCMLQERDALASDAGDLQHSDVALALLEATVDGSAEGGAGRTSPLPVAAGGDASEAALVMSQLTDLERLLERRPLQRARAFLAVLVWCVRRGDVLTGRELLRRVSAMPEASALPSLRVRLAHARGLIAIASNEVEEAWTHLTSALHEVEHTRSGVRAEQLRASIVAQSLDVAADAVRVALASEPDDVASRLFVALESMRASTLLEACGGREQRAATNALDGGESSRDVVLLRQRLVGLYRRAEEGKASLSDVHDAEFALELATLRSASREHREIDAARSHESAGTTGQSSTRSEIASLQHAQRVLGDARIVVQFFREADAIGALVFTSRSARVLRSVWPLSLVVSASRRLALATDVLGTEAAPSMPTQLAELGEMLARALARCEVDTREDVAERAIAVVGCQELHALPVASLVARAARSAAAQVPSVWVGDALSKRASPALPPRVLSLGVSDRLAPHMVAEAHAVAQAWQHATTLTADNATSTAMLRELPQHDLVHLSTHCVFDGEFPMSSRVRLADRWVAARELFAVLRPGCVVVLAGCESGQSSGMMGEDRFGLVRAMLAGGASLVVASSWMLHDSSAAWLFPRLHTLLARRVHAAHAVAPERGRSGARAALSLASHTTLALHDVQQEAARDGLPWHRWQGVFAKGQLP